MQVYFPRKLDDLGLNEVRALLWKFGSRQPFFSKQNRFNLQASFWLDRIPRQVNLTLFSLTNLLMLISQSGEYTKTAKSEIVRCSKRERKTKLNEMRKKGRKCNVTSQEIHSLEIQRFQVVINLSSAFSNRHLSSPCFKRKIKVESGSDN